MPFEKKVESEIVSGEVERVVGGLEARVVALEAALKEAVKAKHTCTGDTCHVVDDRINAVLAELEALRLTATPKKNGAARKEECPECGAVLGVPAGVGSGDLVRCGGCRTEFEVGT